MPSLRTSHRLQNAARASRRSAAVRFDPSAEAARPQRATRALATATQTKRRPAKKTKRRAGGTGAAKAPSTDLLEAKGEGETPTGSGSPQLAGLPRLRFIATDFAALEDNDLECFLVAMAGSDGSPIPSVERTVEFQRALVFDSQDVKLGQDTYCVCVDAAATHYGGVKFWAVGNSGTLRVDLSNPASIELGLCGFNIDLPRKHVKAARVALQRVLAT